jgi:3-hydroxyisobutyrate dehydrogenase-like beta-hydroxyacid dehydrogenase
MTTVGFIGAGQIGTPMIERLLSAGHSVSLYARRPDVRTKFAALGAAVADTIASAVAQTDVVLVCVYDDAQLRAVTLGPDGAIANMPAGGVLASHTTGLPSVLDEIADAGEARAIEVLDASFSGAAADVTAGRLTIMLGGPTTATERVAPMLQAYASTIVRTGPRGSGLKTKLLNNLLFTASAQLTAQALRIGDEMGLDRQPLLDVLATSSGGNAFIDRLRTFPDPEAMFARVTPYLTKDYAAVCSTAADLGVDLGVAATVVRDGPIALA